MIYIYIYTNVRMFVIIYIYRYIYISLLQIHIYVCVCMYVCEFVIIYIRIYIYVCYVYVYMYVCNDIHMACMNVFYDIYMYVCYMYMCVCLRMFVIIYIFLCQVAQSPVGISNPVLSVSLLCNRWLNYYFHQFCLEKYVARHPADWKTTPVKGRNKLLTQQPSSTFFLFLLALIIFCQVIQLGERKLWYITGSWRDYWLFWSSLSLENNY